MKIKDKLIQIENRIASLQHQTRGEEIANTIIHGIGFGLSIAALVVLVIFANIYGDFWYVVSFSIFGATLIFLYFSSTLFHFFQDRRLKDFFRTFDYIGIFLLIAGTYTPIAIVYIQGTLGWIILGAVWLIAFVGILLRILFSNKIELILAILYVLMGWVIVFAFKPILSLVPHGVIMWLVIGGISYMSGMFFLSMKKIPFNHAIWHLFVIGGSISHFFGMILYIGK